MKTSKGNATKLEKHLEVLSFYYEGAKNDDIYLKIFLQNEPCDENIREKCLWSHLNNTG